MAVYRNVLFVILLGETTCAFNITLSSTYSPSLVVVDETSHCLMVTRPCQQDHHVHLCTLEFYSCFTFRK